MTEDRSIGYELGFWIGEHLFQIGLVVLVLLVVWLHRKLK